jgi:hypothetical protein
MKLVVELMAALTLWVQPKPRHIDKSVDRPQQMVRGNPVILPYRLVVPEFCVIMAR